MTASDVLDPVEAARNDIGRSKHLIASALDDLTEHHSWLESYHREERRRAQRLRRQEALRRLELKRQRAAWLSRRFAVRAYAVTRTASAVLLRNGRAFLIWAAPRADALSRLAMRRAAAGASWAWAASLSFSRTVLEAGATGLAWTVAASDSAGIVFRRQVSVYAAALSAEVAILAAPGLKRAETGWIRTRHKTRRLAIALETRLSEAWSMTQSAVAHWVFVEAPRLGRVLATTTKASTMRTRVQVAGLSRAALETGRDSWSWAALRVRRVLERRVLERRAIQHRALIVRPGTALACIEPRRARCPAIWTGGR